MMELELKAWVKDRESVLKRMDEIAVFKNHIVREDEYYRRNGDKTYPLRIRKETVYGKNGKIVESRYLLTYKRKRMHKGMEVNDEKECVISSVDVLEAFFEDNGFDLYLKKTKTVDDWECEDEIENVGKYRATFELCNIASLGDFMEIEILSDKCDKNTVDFFHDELERLLDKTRIPKNDIEIRSYAQLLKELS